MWQPYDQENDQSRSILEKKKSTRDKSAYPSTPYRIEAGLRERDRIFAPPPIKADNGKQEKGGLFTQFQQGPPGKWAETEAPNNGMVIGDNSK
ncbi:hypothetical protein AVEN_146091-1 [Araneus ventricosus]|uniref:Uncharacterized protein n=1 Tax=Araneus ventricosus TaxID=182803 RepID=A0A4Y2GQG6_ARAVE|nr:hypothetical protein AVEN_146091-1 [Araneus ventricosus]